MAADQFNSLGGFSVGIPEISVIDTNGNVVTNVLALQGNVAANSVFANNYLFANGQPFSGGGNATAAGSNTEVQFNNAPLLGASPNFTFNTDTNTLTIIGNIVSNGLSATNVSFVDGSEVNLGSVNELKISGGTISQVLTTDGNSNLSWTTVASVVGGNNTQIQFNDNGVFNGSDKFTFDKTTGNVTITDDLTANSLTLGSGIFKFSRTSVFHATTISTSTQEILALDAEGLAGADLTIISTDATSNSRQITKLSIVIYDGIISYNDTSTIAVNNYLAEFSVNYDSGGSKLQIIVSPSASNFMNHKMQIIRFNE
jgi:hypothetical protein